MAVKTPIYLDHLATTPIDPRVLDFLHQVQREYFGNPASHHAPGWAAAKLVETARKQVADLVGATPEEIIFTSGATEANNLALFGACEKLAPGGGHIVVSDLEHEAVSQPADALTRRGLRVTRIACQPDGVLDPEKVAQAIETDTVLVSIIAAQNEVGTLQPLEALGRVCRERGVLLHSDAAQAVGKIPLDVSRWGLGLVSISGHKAYAPKGVGALFVSRKDPRVILEPRQYGGGQERGWRSGTLNVPGIAALGMACQLAQESMASEAVRVSGLRDRLWNILDAGLDNVRRNGSPDTVLPGCLNVSFSGLKGKTILSKLTTLAVSTGSACSSISGEPSRVLQAMGLDSELATSSLRFGLGRFTTEEEVEYAGSKVVEVVNRMA